MLASPERITREEMLAWREARAAEAAIVDKELEQERRDRMTALGRKSLDGDNHISKQKRAAQKAKRAPQGVAMKRPRCEGCANALVVPVWSAWEITTPRFIRGERSLFARRGEAVPIRKGNPANPVMGMAGGSEGRACREGPTIVAAEPRTGGPGVLTKERAPMVNLNGTQDGKKRPGSGTCQGAKG